MKSTNTPPAIIRSIHCTRQGNGREGEARQVLGHGQRRGAGSQEAREEEGEGKKEGEGARRNAGQKSCHNNHVADSLFTADTRPETRDLRLRSIILRQEAGWLSVAVRVLIRDSPASS
jgi:hypothetical protein